LIEVAFFLYDGVTALDAVGPYDVFAYRSPNCMSASSTTSRRP
jgi:putative intracellular protease/amidase